MINNRINISSNSPWEEILEKIDFKELINNLIDNRSDLINNKNINLKFEYNNLNDYLIDGDKVLLELIISNVLGNAIKYSGDKGNVLITLESEENILIFAISDSGIGIPEKEIKMIFKQFYRASNLNGKKVDGSGLGLSLVKEIVERLNGSININSPSTIGNTLNPGTVVRIILPTKQKSNSEKI